MERLATNLARVRSRIQNACQVAGRRASEVRLVAVTKSVSPEWAAELAVLAGANALAGLGENRVSELERKHAYFQARSLAATWHFIGHIQRNKARRVLLLADVIHSIDSERLLNTLSKLATEESRHPGILLQVKLTDDDAKTGLAPEQVPALVERIQDQETLPLLGLMTMASVAPTRTPSRSASIPGSEELALGGAQEDRHDPLTTFRTLAVLAESLPRSAFANGEVHLSMGMSGDLEAAVQAGATLVRIGGALFEGMPRPQPTPTGVPRPSDPLEGASHGE